MVPPQANRFVYVYDGCVCTAKLVEERGERMGLNVKQAPLRIHRLSVALPSTLLWDRSIIHLTDEKALTHLAIKQRLILCYPGRIFLSIASRMGLRLLPVSYEKVPA
jgi:hypothetical protein